MKLLYSESLYNEVLGVTYDFLYPSNGKISEKEPRHSETSFFIEVLFENHIFYEKVSSIKMIII